MTTAPNRLGRGSLTPILIAGLAALLAVSGRAQSGRVLPPPASSPARP